jgi:ATP-dependent DNA helicase RecQ
VQLAKLERMKQYADALSCQKILLSILVNSLQRIVEIVIFVKIHHFFDGTILAQKHYRQLLDYKKPNHCL